MLMLQLLLKTSDIWKRPDNRQGWSSMGYRERDIAAEEADQTLVKMRKMIIFLMKSDEADTPTKSRKDNEPTKAYSRI